MQGVQREPSGPGAGRQRLRGCKARPCPESRDGVLWVGCRVTTPAGSAEGSALAQSPEVEPLAQSCVGPAGFDT